MAQVTLSVPASWKTTLFGALTAAGAGMVLSSDPTVQIIGKILTILGPVLFGLFAKDSNVTGGTVDQGTVAPS
jgi:hypothetical protein